MSSILSENHLWVPLISAVFPFLTGLSDPVSSSAYVWLDVPASTPPSPVLEVKAEVVDWGLSIFNAAKPQYSWGTGPGGWKLASLIAEVRRLHVAETSPGYLEPSPGCQWHPAQGDAVCMVAVLWCGGWWQRKKPVFSTDAFFFFWVLLVCAW